MTQPTPTPTSVSGQMRAVRAIVGGAPDGAPALASAPIPPSPQLPSSWTPGTVLAVATVLLPAITAAAVTIANAFGYSAARVANLEAQVIALTAEVARAKQLGQGAAEDLGAFRGNAVKWGDYVDASLCQLSVRPGYGCPGIELLPRPSARSGAPQIQPRVEGLKPLGRE